MFNSLYALWAISLFPPLIIEGKSRHVEYVAFNSDYVHWLSALLRTRDKQKAAWDSRYGTFLYFKILKILRLKQVTVGLCLLHSKLMSISCPILSLFSRDECQNTEFHSVPPVFQLLRVYMILSDEHMHLPSYRLQRHRLIKRVWSLRNISIEDRVFKCWYLSQLV